VSKGRKAPQLLQPLEDVDDKVRGMQLRQHNPRDESPFRLDQQQNEEK
jgi:hypothetical protein